MTNPLTPDADIPAPLLPALDIPDVEALDESDLAAVAGGPDVMVGPGGLPP